MSKTGLLNATALRSALFLGAAVALAPSAYAQEVPPTGDTTTAQPADNAETSTDDVILVTGSRIRSPNLESSVPITAITADKLMATGDVSLGDALNDLPSLRSTFSQGNSTRFIGTAGLNILDLRGLGTARTLVLVNGRRHITALPGDYQVDTNTIPSDLLERVEVITGGSSAVYGSDAVSGVVNFVLKKDYEGIRLNAQGGISSRKDRGSYFVSGLAGTNFADGRGNVAVAFEYAEQNPLYFTDRDGLTGAFSGRNQFQLSDSNVGEPQEGDGIPDSVFVRGIRNANTANGGLFRGLRGANGQTTNYVFQTDGSLVANNCTIDYRPVGSGNCLGGMGATLRDTGQLQPGLKRYAANLLAHFDVSDAFKPFIEAKYVHVDAVQQGQPSFIQTGFLATMSLDNPYLTPQARAIIAANLAPGATTFQLQRFNIDFGGRGELHDRDTYRVVAGVQGDFNEDWNYEVSVNYGELRTGLRSLNNLVISRFLNAQDAVRNGAGQIVCGINADADATNDDAACVPINLFGNGSPSREALNYVNTTSTRKEKASEFIVSGSIAGDFSQLFELPGGPIRFALGAEYRRETAFSAFDDLVKSDDTFLNAIQDFNPPAFEVKEAFGELNIPFFRNQPFADELSVSLAGRVSDYKGGAGTVYAYNAGGVYAPIPEIKFRGNYSRSVRAPTQTDLYSPQSVNFAQIQDPCDQNFINNGKPERAANCAAAGIPTTQVNPDGTIGFQNLPARSSSTRFLSGGNPGLFSEKSDSYTFGVVIVPASLIPGFTLTADYYNIKVKGLIAGVGAQEILDTCYDAQTIDNAFCALVFRNADGTFAQPAVLDAPVNFAAQKTSGIDVDVAYRHDFGGVKLDLRAIGSYIINRTNFTNVLDPTEPDRQKSELGDPAYEGQLSAGLDFGTFDVAYKLRYIGNQVVASDYETQNPYNGNPPQNADAFSPSRYPAVYYHDIRVGIKLNNKFNFYGGVDNMFDRQPPLGLLGTAGGDPYDNVGRFFYVGVKADF